MLRHSCFTILYIFMMLKKILKSIKCPNRKKKKKDEHPSENLEIGALMSQQKNQKVKRSKKIKKSALAKTWK